MRSAAVDPFSSVIYVHLDWKRNRHSHYRLRLDAQNGDGGRNKRKKDERQIEPVGDNTLYCRRIIGPWDKHALENVSEIDDENDRGRKRRSRNTCR